MSRLFDALTAWGADVKGSMERMYADEEFYRKCLRMFENDGNFGKLSVAMLAQNYDDAFSAAHTLRKVACTLSLTPLYEALCALTEKLRTRDGGNLEMLYNEVRKEERAFKSMMRDES